MNESEIITIKEARKLLGTIADGLSDALVEELVNELDFIASISIKQLQAEGGQNGDNDKTPQKN